jgi:hypothetical protein
VEKGGGFSRHPDTISKRKSARSLHGTPTPRFCPLSLDFSQRDNTMPIPEPFLQYGLLGIVLFFTGYAVWKFITPIRDSQVELVQTATTSLKGMNEKMKYMTASDKRVEAGVEEIKDGVEDIQRKLS